MVLFHCCAWNERMNCSQTPIKWDTFLLLVIIYCYNFDPLNNANTNTLNKLTKP